MNSRFLIGLVAVTMALPLFSQAQIITTGSGSTPADITGTVNTFRTSIGTLNPNVVGSFGSGRREINWDGVPDTLSAPNNLPANFFNANSPRGAVFSTPGTGFQVSATAASGTPVRFGNIDPSYPNTFQTFSPQRLFTSLGNNVVDVNFFVPGSSTAALVRSFGSVFTDVDLVDTTSIQYFDGANVSLGTYFVPATPRVGTSGQGLSFLGVDFGSSLISRVRITNGNSVLGSGVLDSNGDPIDLVVMDDFIYSEPIGITAVPEPGTVSLFIGVMAFGSSLLIRRRRLALTRG